MRILFLSSGDRAPATRFRINPVARYLSKLGHQCTVRASFPQKYDYFPWLGFRPSQMLKRLVRRLHLAEAALRKFDVLYIEREIFDSPSWAAESRFRRWSPCFVLDLDDAVFLRYPEKFDKLVEMSDLLVAGNNFLRDRFAPVHSRIFVMPTCIDLDVYVPPARRHTGRLPVIGWMGTTSNLQYINVVAPALRRLATRCAFELRLIAGENLPLKEIDLSGVNVRFVRWNPATEVADMAEFDVGIMPLPDDEWSRYKCGLKLLQYMALGIPGVASPVGVNAEIIDHGVNGLVATDSESWESGLFNLVNSAELRRRMGDAGRQTVAERYSLDVNVPKLAAALEAVLHR